MLLVVIFAVLCLVVMGTAAVIEEVLLGDGLGLVENLVAAGRVAHHAATEDELGRAACADKGVAPAVHIVMDLVRQYLLYLLPAYPRRLLNHRRHASLSFFNLG